MENMDKLIAGAQRHDPRDFERLYRICAREIGWYCKRLCGNEFDAQDLLQEVWLTAWQKLPQYAGINFPAWLRSIAHNTFLNTLKKYRLEQLTEEPPDTAPEDELLGPVHITEQRMLRRMLLHTIDRELTSVQRMTVLLYYYDDLPVSEIAGRMECSEGTVKSRLYLARKRLREALGQSAALTVTGTAIILQTHPAAPVSESVEVTETSSVITELSSVTETLQMTLTTETAETGTFPFSETVTETGTTWTSSESSALTSTADTTAQTDPTEPGSALTETAPPETTVPSASAQPAASTSTESGTETETTVPLPSAPVLPGFTVEVWEEDGQYLARILPDTAETTERLKLYYSLAQPPEGYAAAAGSSDSGYPPESRTLQYPHESGEDVLVFTQRTRSAASPTAFGERFVLGEYDLTAVTVGAYAGWLAVRRDDPAACTLEWDVGDYLFTVTAGRSDPEALIAAARNLKVG